MLVQIDSLKQNLHYELDEKARNISLTENGITEAEKWLQINDLYDIKDPWAPYIFNALKAKEFFLKDTHYIIKEEEIVIVDEFTGRIMTGRRWSDGLHQSIEANEAPVDDTIRVMIIAPGNMPVARAYTMLK